MSMTYQQFVDYATDLKNHSDSINDGWSLCQYQCPMVKNKLLELNDFLSFNYQNL